MSAATKPTIVDKASKVVTIRKIKNKSADAVIKGFEDVFNSTFYNFKTITADNGTEFAGHEKIAEMMDADFYFAKPYSSWERGLNVSAQLSSEALLGLIDWEVPGHKISEIILRSTGR
ncbi:hypothetical protein C9J21_22435 [Photobacterium phosphoreum]|nr:IS30 family transposase [Photobacterium phosphoreum]PSW20891.1 hypothetical protein C9J21_22435 [Photobacterium phosphoreum]